MKFYLINKYFIIQILSVTGISTFLLVGFLLYGNLVKHDEYLLQALSVSPKTFIQILFYLIPYALSFALPFGFILSLLLCYGKWSSTNEILAIRSHGLGILSWGGVGVIFSVLLSLISTYIFLEWAPLNRAKFDKAKSSIIWSNLNSLLEKENEFEIEFLQESSKKNENFHSLTNEGIEKISLSVGSTNGKNWSNVRILLIGEKGKLLRIVNSKGAFAKFDESASQLILELNNVDFESIQDQENDNFYVSFQKWNEPLVLPINSPPQKTNINRMSFSELVRISKGQSLQKLKAELILSKGFALGTSPFFLSLVLIPLSITKGRRESMSNLSFGICISVLYYCSTTYFEDFAESYSSTSLIWVPNLLSFIIGTYLFYKFEKCGAR